ncbi:DoxX family protein [Desertimonas flava]|uniref:DoxX family protein n=1 Tax=Desertimonas flava TaxID=2064846 RepID=UPI000E342A2E|nr:DoxX family protein [Desertimonas flava]
MIRTLVTVAAIVANAAIAFADFAAAPFVLANSSDVGVPRRWLPSLGALKLAGAAGLLVGMTGADPIGLAASVGLTAFFTGALVAHVRAAVFHNIAFPAAYLALAAATLVVNVTS